ncbi:MAG TPA: NADH-quinone oxidoreductase subunit A [Methanomassiliicoccales archaeon]|nr:NADH-quinone oxidoreductase subunit A [Methanomassiliicoccales archaeon]
MLAFYVSRFFRPTKFSTLRETTYECGELPIGQAQIQFHVQFYIYAIIFVVFDIVTVFLLIWAMAYDLFVIDETNILNNMPLIIAATMVGMMLIGVYYAIKKEKILWI